MAATGTEENSSEKRPKLPEISEEARQKAQGLKEKANGFFKSKY
jgi:hypothetical protein